ncbi:MAG TPA: hypothetical protein VNE38_02800 [Ktedonobacteraceae bacterium]|nr:hypothetical protein [Ktedonobacteraceae bacterium]
MQKKYALPGMFLLIAMMLFVSACGGSSQTAGQLILNSSTAMKQIKAVHVAMTATINLAVSGTPGSSSTASTPGNVNATASVNGDEVLPDQSSFKLTTSGIGKLAFAEITKGNQLYFQNAQGQWYVIDKSKLSGTNNSSSTLLSNASIPDFNKLLDLVQKDAQITDHGDQTLNGVSLRHITVTLDKNGLAQLIENTGQLKGLTGVSQQSLNDMLNSVSNFSASLDFWFDESTSYLHRFEIKLNMALNLNKFATPTANSTTPSGFSLKADIVLDLSKFNDPSIKITAPTNAIQTDNPGVIFGGA